MAGFRQQDPCLLGQYHRQNEGRDNDRKSRCHSTREHQCPLLHRKGLVRNRQGPQSPGEPLRVRDLVENDDSAGTVPGEAEPYQTLEKHLAPV